jgi:hypothetical protein
VAVCERRLQRGISFCFLTNGSNCLACLPLLDAELVRTLRSNSAEPIEVFREAMDLSRFSSNSYQALLRGFLRAKYADKKIDVAVAIMAPALDVLLTYGDLIFPGTPIVFCGLDIRQLGTRSLPSNAYGVPIKRGFAPTLELTFRLHPEREAFAQLQPSVANQVSGPKKREAKLQRRQKTAKRRRSAACAL